MYRERGPQMQQLYVAILNTISMPRYYNVQAVRTFLGSAVQLYFHYSCTSTTISRPKQM